MRLTSPNFDRDGYIPRTYTCDGAGINPALDVDEIPHNARSMALMVNDPDSPTGDFVHWLVYDMPVVRHIDEGSVPGKEGYNDFKRKGYGGPCPTSGQHRYVFRLFALDQGLDLRDGLEKRDVEDAMSGHVIEEADLVGIYSRY